MRSNNAQNLVPNLFVYLLYTALVNLHAIFLPRHKVCIICVSFCLLHDAVEFLSSFTVIKLAVHTYNFSSVVMILPNSRSYWIY